jgi:hypothetical protein
VVHGTMFLDWYVLLAWPWFYVLKLFPFRLGVSEGAVGLQPAQKPASLYHLPRPQWRVCHSGNCQRGEFVLESFLLPSSPHYESICIIDTQINWRLNHYQNYLVVSHSMSGSSNLINPATPD